MVEEFLVLHPNFNVTGTDTTRFSSNQPNQQNISKSFDPRFGDFNLRKCYCPLPGREWYSGDYSNIELRIFAYACGDKSLIKAFEEGKSVHLIIAEALWPKEFAECLKREVKDPSWAFKTKYESTLYQWIKNGNFSLIYGAGEAKADRTYHQPGAYRKIRTMFPKIDSFMKRMGEQARDYGYVTTLGGYRLYIPYNQYGKLESHKAVNYFVQGSAGWAITLAMLRIWDYLNSFNDKLSRIGGDASYSMIMQVHDELDFDFPIPTFGSAAYPVTIGEGKKAITLTTQNLQVITDIARLMEQSGDDLGMPTPVEFERHPDTWAVGEKLTLAL